MTPVLMPLSISPSDSEAEPTSTLYAIGQHTRYFDEEAEKTVVDHRPLGLAPVIAVRPEPSDPVPPPPMRHRTRTRVWHGATLLALLLSAGAALGIARGPRTFAPSIRGAQSPDALDSVVIQRVVDAYHRHVL